MKRLLLILFLIPSLLAFSQYENASPAVKRLAAGTGHGLAILVDGTLWSWGRNSAGQLGDTTIQDKYIPVRVGNDSNWESIAAGSAFSHAIKKDGTLWGWGINKVGQLGIRNSTYTYHYKIPVQIGTDADWQAVSSSLTYTVGLKKDGSIWVWGNNLYGLFSEPINQYKPLKIKGYDNSSFIEIAAGDEFFIAQKADGSLWTKGALNSKLQIDVSRGAFHKLSDDTTWISFDAGKSHALAVRGDGSLWAWGRNENGQLGLGDTASAKHLVRMGKSTDWQSVYTGADYSIGLKKEGSVWFWGNASFLKERAKSTNVPSLFDAATRYKNIEAGPGLLLLSLSKANLDGLVKTFTLGQDGTFKSFIKTENK